MMSNCDSPGSRHILRSIDDKIDEFSNAILLKRQRNCHIPISRLPTEILSVIFHYNIFDGQSEYYYDSRWISVTYVCHVWREVALNSASLWSYWGIPNSGWIETFFSRSGQAPLYLRIWPRMDVSSKPFFELLRKQNCMDRVQELHILGSASFLTGILDAFVHRQASDDSASEVLSGCSVRSISIRCRTFPEYCLPKTFQSLRFPHLLRLKLVDCVFDWSSAFFDSAVLVHLTITMKTVSDNPTSSCLLSALAKQPRLQELILNDFYANHADDTDIFPVNLPNLRLIKLEGSISNCFTLLTRLSYPRTKVTIIITISTYDEQDFTSHAIPFFSKHYGDHGDHDVSPTIKYFSITYRNALHILCAPFLKPSERPTDHEPYFYLRIGELWQEMMAISIMRVASTVLPLHDVRSFVYGGVKFGHAIWKYMFETMTNLEEVELFGKSVGEAVLAMDLTRVRKHAAYDDEGDRESHINHGDIKKSNSLVPNDQSLSSELTERDEAISLILLPKLRTLRIIDADFSHPFLADFAPWLESRKHANHKLDLLSLKTCRFVDLNKVEEYREHVKEVSWDRVLA